MTSSINPDQTAHEKSDQGLHYLHRPIRWNILGKYGIYS